MDQIIHPDQKGFVPGRYIGEVVRTTYDIIQYAKEHDKSGVLLLVDFEKAFDSISFSYIDKCLNFLNFGPDMKKWIRILLDNFKASINHCGNVSLPFVIGRGCRQGDPIASYLFILSIEILAHRLRNDPNIAGFSFGDHNSHLLEIYADDMSIFLEPNAQNIRAVVQILEKFYQISGLKISVSKTKAIWFGKNFNSSSILCPEIDLVWTKSFTLLGITFDNNLENMEDNFWHQFRSIEKLLATWIYRHLTPYGKVTVIKTLALSKLSHLALVIPTPSKKMLKTLEVAFFKFIWDNGSEKVRRVDAKLPEALGGINVPNIEKYWSAFKFSWIRRALETQAFWPTLLETQLKNALGYDISVSKLLTYGPSLCLKLSKTLKNKFWSQVLSSVAELYNSLCFKHPEKLTNSSIWYNPFLKKGKKVLTPSDYPDLSNVVTYLGDFFYPLTTIFMSYTDFCARYSDNIQEENFIEVRYVIKLALQVLGFPQHKLDEAVYPIRPLPIEIANLSKKGCSSYAKLLGYKDTLQNNMVPREEKWHLELGCTYSNIFWEKTRKFYTRILNENSIKWLQFQIVRNSLQTNKIVHHFRPHVTPLCSFCLMSDETVSHLFWYCPKTATFLRSVFDMVNSTGLMYSPSRNTFLFGSNDTPIYSPLNYLTLHLKRFIWSSKFKTCTLSLVSFKTYFKKILTDLKTMYELKGIKNDFDVWLPIWSLM